LQAAEFVAVSAPDVHFEGTIFRGPLSFRDANFRTVRFQDTSDTRQVCQFPPHERAWWSFRDRRAYPRIDLRGFVYERILVDKESFEILEFIEPFDVQPYRQAEKVLRGMGNASAADRIYLSQRWRTWRYHIARRRHLLLAFGELVHWALANFGVRPYRLAVYALMLMVVSTWLFAPPNAVSPKKDSGCVAHTLGPTEAVNVSLSYLLPVELPAGGCWEATRLTASCAGGYEITFLLWATATRLAGWILVPLGVAALSGLLRRIPG